MSRVLGVSSRSGPSPAVRGGSSDRERAIAKTPHYLRSMADDLLNVMDDVVPTNDDEYEEAIEGILDAKNRLLRKSGFSPYQICFGRDPPLPGALMREEPSVIANSAALHDEKFHRVMEIRQYLCRI